MGKYYSYGQRLNDAFIEARTAYQTAFDRMQQAEKNRREADTWHPERYIGENAARKASAEAEYIRAKAALDGAWSAWEQFNDTAASLRGELEREIRRNAVVDPDAIDDHALKLLESGVMSADDFEAMAQKYDDCPTMLKFVAKYAREAAKDSENLNDAARGRLYAVSMDCQNGHGSALRTWDALETVAKTCSGQSRGRRKNPDLVQTMATHWEEFSSEAIDAL